MQQREEKESSSINKDGIVLLVDSVTMADRKENGMKMLLPFCGHWLMTACEADNNFMLA